MLFETMSPEELDSMTSDQLDAENQRAGAAVDELRDYRRQIGALVSKRLEAQALRAKLGDDLTDEQIEAISATVKAPRLSMRSAVNNG